MPVSLTLFSSRGFESWDIERPPLIPEAMPVLIDDLCRHRDYADSLLRTGE